VAGTIVKRLLCCGFRRAVKEIARMYPCWWGLCRDTNVFPRCEYRMFYVLYPLVNYLLILSRLYRHLVGLLQLGDRPVARAST
jgi:hypothetical protein